MTTVLPSGPRVPLRERLDLAAQFAVRPLVGILLPGDSVSHETTVGNLTVTITIIAPEAVEPRMETEVGRRPSATAPDTSISADKLNRKIGANTVADLQARVLALFAEPGTALTGREIGARLGSLGGLQQALSRLDRERVLCRAPGAAVYQRT